MYSERLSLGIYNINCNCILIRSAQSRIQLRSNNQDNSRMVSLIYEYYFRYIKRPTTEYRLSFTCNSLGNMMHIFLNIAIKMGVDVIERTMVESQRIRTPQSKVFLAIDYIRYLVILWKKKKNYDDFLVRLPSLSMDVCIQLMHCHC